MTNLIYQWKASSKVGLRFRFMSILIKVLIFILVFTSSNYSYVYVLDAQNDLLCFEHVQKAVHYYAFLFR